MRNRERRPYPCQIALQAARIIPLIALLASPAFAQSVRGGKAQRSAPVRTYNVPVGKPRFGADPDPNVRFEEMRQFNWRKGGS